MGFVEVMRERGMMAQVTHEDELIAHLSEGTRTAYLGIDPTAESMHVGNLMTIMAARRWQAAGHRVVLLMGGATALIGDPTGKTEMRKMLTSELINANIEKFKKQLSPLIDLEDPARGVVVNNADWFAPMGYLGLLREVGQHFSINRMMAAESVKQRLERGLSFLEFNYMILQSYDFWHLNKTQDCTVQLGGDDQWSNMLGGMDLVRKKERGQAYCFTVPLLQNTAGQKMGKTESGAVWLNREMTKPYDLFQYFRNLEDEMVKPCLSYFTDIPMAEVESLTQVTGNKINEAKVVLAWEVTKLLHGEKDADEAKAAAASLFAAGAKGGEGDAPEVSVASAEFSDGSLGLLQLLVNTKVFPSKAEARRMVQQGGLSLNGEKIKDPTYEVPENLLKADQGLLVKKGKKHYFRLRISS